jgi:hypothetical protein
MIIFLQETLLLANTYLISLSNRSVVSLCFDRVHVYMNTIYAADHWKIHGASTLSSLTLLTSTRLSRFCFLKL